MKTLKLNKNWTLTIPKDFRAIFKPSDEFACFVEGDTLIIKRITPTKLSEIAERVKEKPISMKTIAKEVHTHRQEKRKE